MSLVSNPKDGDNVSVRQAIAKLGSSKLGPTSAPTLAGLTVTNAAVLGSDSVVFQPNTDSTTFFQILDADGGTPILSIDSTNERIGIGLDNPGTTLQVYTVDNSALQLHGPNVTALSLIINNEGGGDPRINFKDNGSTKWSIGFDNSDSDKFKISENVNLQTNARVTIEQGGNATFVGTIAASNYAAANLLTAAATNAGEIDFTAASKKLDVEDNAVVDQDYSSDASPTWAGATFTGVVNASTGEVLVEDNATNAPTGKSDGYVGVVKIGADGRLYFAVEGSMYYIDGTISAVPVTGNPIGLLLALTYNIP